MSLGFSWTPIDPRRRRFPACGYRFLGVGGHTTTQRHIVPYDRRSLLGLCSSGSRGTPQIRKTPANSPLRFIQKRKPRPLSRAELSEQRSFVHLCPGDVSAARSKCPLPYSIMTLSYSCLSKYWGIP